MTSLKTLVIGLVSTATLAVGLLGAVTSAEARPSRGAAVTAGIIGGLALGAIVAPASRHVVVVERRRVRAARPCGCRH